MSISPQSDLVVKSGPELTLADTGADTSGADDTSSRPPDIRLIAKAYRERGWRPIPLHPRSKVAVAKNWAQQVTDDKTHWPGNVGIVLGKASGGLVDLDLDCEEARILAAAVLPPTGLRFGRPGAPGSHRLYDCGLSAPGKATTGARFAPKFGDDPKIKDKPLLEVRSTGGQTMCPPSIHPNGERLDWAEYGDPAVTDSAVLLHSASVLAAVTLMCRHFPGEGQRFDAYAVMTGVLLRWGLDVGTVEAVVEVFTSRFDSEKPRERVRSVAELKRRLDSGSGDVAGFPRLVEVFGKEVANRVREWIGSDDWQRGKTGAIIPSSLHNMTKALAEQNVRLRYDEFGDNYLIQIGDAAETRLDDPLFNRLWLSTEEKLAFSPEVKKFRAVVEDQARQNKFHPVRDYLNGLQWDGKKRIDTWLFDYGGATRKDDDYNRYVGVTGRMSLVAAVRRIRQPGCKFDEMSVWINDQGTGKSEALATLATRPEWFSDSIDLTADEKKIIEQTRGKWIVEIAEMRGRRGEVDHIKASLSRQVDSSRLAYGYFRTDASRSFMFFGTVNDPKFLTDPTGNRRYWPVLGVVFDIEALKRDVDQLWAEAAAAEAAGESIRLAKELWPVAARAQGAATVDDTWDDVLETHLGGIEKAKIRAADVWNILNVGNRTPQGDNDRMGKAMRKLGWVRTDNPIWFSGGNAKGYTKGATKGDAGDEVSVHAYFDQDDRSQQVVVVTVGHGAQAKRRAFINGVERNYDDVKEF
jgi:hypothetical protein